MSIVIDASAVLAILRDEPGADVATHQAQGALLSAVNLTEILAKASDLGLEIDAVRRLVAELDIVIAPFDDDDAITAARLRAATRSSKTSLADRACLALAVDRQLPVLTGDRVWAELDLGVEIVLIR